MPHLTPFSYRQMPSGHQWPHNYIQIKKEVCLAYSLVNYCPYFELQNNWSSLVRETVVWPSFSSTLHIQINNKYSILQFFHNKLPLGHKQQKWLPTFNGKCQACILSEATFQYRVDCPNSDYTVCKYAFFQKRVSQCQKLQLDPMLMEIYVDELHAGFTNQSLVVENYPDSYSSLIMDQNNIRWFKGFKGLWTGIWLEKQKSHSN